MPTMKNDKLKIKMEVPKLVMCNGGTLNFCHDNFCLVSY